MISVFTKVYDYLIVWCKRVIVDHNPFMVGKFMALNEMLTKVNKLQF